MVHGFRYILYCSKFPSPLRRGIAADAVVNSPVQIVFTGLVFQGVTICPLLKLYLPDCFHIFGKSFVSRTLHFEVASAKICIGAIINFPKDSCISARKILKVYILCLSERWQRIVTYRLFHIYICITFTATLGMDKIKIFKVDFSRLILYKEVLIPRNSSCNYLRIIIPFNFRPLIRSCYSTISYRIIALRTR